jgi:hypothetical protein
MHEQASSSFSRNLTMKESLHLTHQHSNHALTNDNHTLVNNQSPLTNNINNNCSSTTNSTVESCETLSLKFKDFIASSRHACVSESTVITATTAVLSYSEDRINNNSDASSSNGLAIMSHKNFMLSFDQQHPSSTQAFVGGGETLMSPAEAPFGRRYAEISQFKNHPNVEW